MAEEKQSNKPVRVEIIANKGVHLQGRGEVFPGSVIEVNPGLANNIIKLGWAKKSDAKLGLKIPDNIAEQLGKKKGE